MTPESPLDQVKRHFKTFKVETPKTISADQVLIEQEVAFKKECREEANETLTIHKVWNTLNDGDMTYLMLQEAVDGPITDGNRIQKVNDCEIRTYVYMIDAKDKAPKISNSQKSQAQKVASVTTPTTAKTTSNSGCRSDAASTLLIPILILLVGMKMKFSSTN